MDRGRRRRRPFANNTFAAHTRGCVLRGDHAGEQGETLQVIRHHEQVSGRHVRGSVRDSWGVACRGHGQFRGTRTTAW